ncbi:hypothetical protein DFJ73DRAFT_214249 [Zopfochytrium polystomum]|nr:hypothetical protein DFJ73DRAFT_214249 [Zopfochytrium polystomum]
MVWAIAHRAKTSTGLVSRFRLHSSSSSSPAPQPPTQLSAFAHLLDLSGCGGVASEDAPRDGELVIREGFLSPQEHDLLVDACSRKLGRLARGPYAEGHFDQVIKGYKEASISSWSRTPLVAATSVLNNADEGPVRLMARFRTAVNEELQCRGLEPVKDWLDPHILELREGNSGIGAHVDNLQGV